MRRTLTALLTLVALGSAAAPAAADPKAVLRDCQDGAIEGKYSQKDYSEALRTIGTDVDEYTDCRDVINRARLGAFGGPAGDGGGGGAAAGGAAGGAATPGVAGAPAGRTAAQLLQSATPAERSAIQKAVTGAGDEPVVIGGRPVSPDTTGLSPAGAANVVPTPLVVALALLGVALALGATQIIRSRVLARRDPSA